jgi:hypothetical protein
MFRRIMSPQPPVSNAMLATCFMVVSCLAFSLTMKMEATGSSEMPVDFQWTMQCYISEDRTLHNHCCRTSDPTIFMFLVIAPESFNCSLLSDY